MNYFTTATKTVSGTVWGVHTLSPQWTTHRTTSDVLQSWATETYWCKVNSGGLSGPGNIQSDTSRRETQRYSCGCWLGTAGRALLLFGTWRFPGHRLRERTKMSIKKKQNKTEDQRDSSVVMNTGYSSRIWVRFPGPMRCLTSSIPGDPVSPYDLRRKHSTYIHTCRQHTHTHKV